MKNIFIFITLISCVLANKQKLLHCTTDEVASGSFKYYSLTFDGDIKIILLTKIGDADLYVSQITAKPTYELDQYCLKSATTGEDNIVIPNSFKRPITIGVYGHPSHNNSKYILLAYEITDAENESYESNFDIDQIEVCSTEEQRPFILMTIAWYLLDLLFQILF